MGLIRIENAHYLVKSLEKETGMNSPVQKK